MKSLGQIWMNLDEQRVLELNDNYGLSINQITTGDQNPVTWGHYRCHVMLVGIRSREWGRVRGRGLGEGEIRPAKGLQ